MKLKINSDKSIVEIQNEFNSLFPYLRIEFSHNGQPDNDRPMHRRSALNRDTIGQFHPILNSNTIEINKDMSVAEIKRMFVVEFGLAARIYRKSDNFWLETRLTEKLTLAQQNQHGKDLS